MNNSCANCSLELILHYEIPELWARGIGDKFSESVRRNPSVVKIVLSSSQSNNCPVQLGTHAQKEEIFGSSNREQV